jgi:DNA-3-methyladenine glycosylase II
MTLWRRAGALPATPPFNFKHSLRVLAGAQVLPASQAIVQGRSNLRLLKALAVGGRMVAAEARAASRRGQPHLAYTLYAAEPLDAALAAAALDRLAFWLSLDDNVLPLYALGRADPVFVPVMERLHGYHQVKFTSPFETACWAVLSQRNQWTTAQRMHAALAETFGFRLRL